ncbi:hypothetical protein ACQP0C_21555 [Nocardia sp. CA-129566]|uniref:hypothetical protein n=1 Tax=Nocardia sp. CA-129566 TaxID=3239976 RepID=UPI003D9972B9
MANILAIHDNDTAAMVNRPAQVLINFVPWSGPRRPASLRDRDFSGLVGTLQFIVRIADDGACDVECQFDPTRFAADGVESLLDMLTSRFTSMTAPQLAVWRSGAGQRAGTGAPSGWGAAPTVTQWLHSYIDGLVGGGGGNEGAVPGVWGRGTRRPECSGEALFEGAEALDARHLTRRGGLGTRRRTAIAGQNVVHGSTVRPGVGSSSHP